MKKLTRREAQLMRHARKNAVQAFKNSHVIEFTIDNCMMQRATIQEIANATAIAGLDVDYFKTRINHYTV